MCVCVFVVVIVVVVDDVVVVVIVVVDDDDVVVVVAAAAVFMGFLLLFFGFFYGAMLHFRYSFATLWLYFRLAKNVIRMGFLATTTTSAPTKVFLLSSLTGTESASTTYSS